ncbi:MAG: peptide chain release factor-like protein [Phycisphaerae bacterium]|nr:peptide chain release factor-like protein [Phycisphaerae bacterium]
MKQHKDTSRGKLRKDKFQGQAGYMINFGITQQKKQELEQRMRNCNLLENDIEETFVRSGGAGGQKVNKSSTCVHLKHIPSKLSVKVQKSRSQGLNRYYARKQMCELLENKLLGKESLKDKKIEKIRKQKDRRRRRIKKF